MIYDDGDSEDIPISELSTLLHVGMPTNVHLEGSANEAQGILFVEAKTTSHASVPAEFSSSFVFGYSGEKEKCVPKVQYSSNLSSTPFPMISNWSK